MKNFYGGLEALAGGGLRRWEGCGGLEALAGVELRRWEGRGGLEALAGGCRTELKLRGPAPG